MFGAMECALIESKQPQPRDLSVLAPDLRCSLLGWWEIHGRRNPDQKPWMFTAEGRYPEPGEPLDAGGIWIAEVMLQQTQLKVVLPYWRRWMQAFPSVDALASASLEQVGMFWQGLGYYSRARRLHAKIVLVLDVDRLVFELRHLDVIRTSP